MVATSTFLKLTPLQWNPSFAYKQHRHHHPNVHFYSKPQSRSNLGRLQIAVKYKQPTCFDADGRSESNHAQLRKNSLYKIEIQIKKTLDSLKKPAIAAVFMLGLLLLCDNNWALAASGGRIGGSAFSSRSQSSKSSSSSSTTFSKSSSSSGSSYSSPSSSGSSYSSPSSSGSSYSSPSSSASSYSSPSLYLVTIVIAAAVAIAWVVDKSQNDILTNAKTTSVLRLQVGLLGSARTLQQDFNSLAETADTSTPEGLSYVLTEATLALLRHPDYCISCYSSVDVKPCIEEGEKQFNLLSVEERGKFDEETLVNVNSIKIRSSKIHRASGLNNEYIVVTILVATEGTLKLETIKGSGDLKEALHKLGSIPSNKILAVEVLWTPQNDKDVLSERELLEDYPLLRPF
ncbi:PREDICTED: uncharacterized protein LOC104700972 [Camelina sativa]|uniref:Uncharacterized protein LOC104700972 n=1 Tax=Camelina sativa TaxID=90675 RepID=A0ABM0SR19_CAMSA|nr:PREDICTED: uncharacterized protein LOC104700972 [Camelina sativa]